MVALDPFTPVIVTITFAIFLLSFFLKIFKMPSVITYIIAGVILGPGVLGLINDFDMISTLGTLGVVLLLFFIGMEISVKNLMKNWKVALYGTTFQILLSVGVMLLMGYFLDWPYQRGILLGFVISLSSTAVILKILKNNDEMKSREGQNVVSVLLMQDIIIIPMIIILGYIGGDSHSVTEIYKQIFGALLLILIVVWVVKKKEFDLPFMDKINGDRELQVFIALLVCFGLSFIASLFGLSSALGAFVAGIVISSARERGSPSMAHLRDLFSKSA